MEINSEQINNQHFLNYTCNYNRFINNTKDRSTYYFSNTQSPHLSDFLDALYVFGKFRCGVGPLIFFLNGRYECFLIENRICFNNNFQINNCIEDEKHVLLYCPVHEDLRQYLFNNFLIL